MPKLKDALSLAERGIAVFPCHWMLESGLCSCGSTNCDRNKGKHPLFHKGDLTRGCLDATTDPDQIRAWWSRWPEANVGIATGPAHKKVVLDFDTGEGKEGLTHFRRLFGDEKSVTTRLARTGSGGYHVYFETDESFPCGKNVFGPNSGVDVRGVGGYVLGPPSNHKSGGRYEWLNDSPIQTLPESLSRLLKETICEEAEERDPVSAADWTRTVLDGQGRDNYLIRLAGKMARSGMPYKELATTLWGINKRNVVPPKTRKDVIRIAKSALRMERDRRDGKRPDKRSETPIIVLKEEKKKEEAKEIPHLISSQAFEERFYDQDVEWLIPGWVPYASLGLLLAEPEMRKTWTLIDMLLTISGSRPLFFDQFPATRNGCCFFYQQEDSFPRLWERVTKMMNLGEPQIGRDGIIKIPTPPDYPDILWHVKRSLNLRDKEELREMVRAIRKYNPLMIGIDPMYSLLELKDYGAETAKEMGFFKLLRDDYGCSFLIAHHMKKGDPSGSRARNMGWGSQFLNAWQEFGIELMDGGSPDRIEIERHEKNSQRPPNSFATFHIDDFSYRVEWEESTEDKKAQNLELIRACLMENKVRSYSEVMQLTGIRSKGVVVACMKLLGATEKTKGFYVLPSSAMPDIRIKDFK